MEARTELGSTKEESGSRMKPRSEVGSQVAAAMDLRTDCGGPSACGVKEGGHRECGVVREKEGGHRQERDMEDRHRHRQERDMEDRHRHRHMEGSHRAAPVICIESGESEGSVVEIPQPTRPVPKHRNKGRKRTRVEQAEMNDEFSRALEVPVDLSRVSGGRFGNRHQEPHPSHQEPHPLSRNVRSPWDGDVVIVEPAHLARERSPTVPAELQSAAGKRKGKC